MYSRAEIVSQEMVSSQHSIQHVTSESSSQIVSPLSEGGSSYHEEPSPVPEPVLPVDFRVDELAYEKAEDDYGDEIVGYDDDKVERYDIQHAVERSVELPSETDAQRTVGQSLDDYQEQNRSPDVDEERYGYIQEPIPEGENFQENGSLEFVYTEDAEKSDHYDYSEKKENIGQDYDEGHPYAPEETRIESGHQEYDITEDHGQLDSESHLDDGLHVDEKGSQEDKVFREDGHSYPEDDYNDTPVKDSDKRDYREDDYDEREGEGYDSSATFIPAPEAPDEAITEDIGHIQGTFHLSFLLYTVSVLF